MPRLVSVFDYEVIPFTQVDLSTPVVQIKTFNEYQILLTGPACDAIRGSRREMRRYASFGDYLLAENAAEMVDGKMVGYQHSTNGRTLEQVLAMMADEDYCYIMGGGLLQVREILGRYLDADTLITCFYRGEMTET